MKDILVSYNSFGESTYEQIKYDDLTYTINNLKNMKGEQYRFVHFCVPYDDIFFKRLDECVNITNKIDAIIMHQPVEYEELIKFQRRTNIPIIYVPHEENEKIWRWSMIGDFSDKLFGGFTTILDKAGIKEEHHVMLGL